MCSSIFNVRRRKAGGIWFVRIGRLQFSFCLCRGFEPAARVYSARTFRPPYRGGNTMVVDRDR